MKLWAIILLVLGVAGLGLSIAVCMLAAPTQIRCNAQTCVWQKSGLFGSSHDETYPTASLRDSRIEYDTHRTGLTTRWVVTGPAGTLELAATDNDKDGAFFEQLAKDLQHFLAHPSDRAFDAFFGGTNRHPWYVLAVFAALALAGGIYLMRA